MHTHTDFCPYCLQKADVNSLIFILKTHITASWYQSHQNRLSLTHSLTAVTKLYEFTHFFQTPKKPDPVLAVTVTPAFASVCLGLLEISIPLSCYSAFLSAIKPLHQAPTAFSRGLPVGYDCLFLSLTVSSLNLCCRFWFELSWLIICESSQFHKSTWCWILQSNWK